MAAFQNIDKDIEAITQSIARNDIERLIGCVENYFKNYTDGAVDSYINTLKESVEIQRFYNKLKEYSALIDAGLGNLNQYLGNEFANFINIANKAIFLRVVKTLINLNRFEIASIDADSLCKLFLMFLSTASSSDADILIFSQIYEILTLPIEEPDTPLDSNGIPLKRIWIVTVLSDWTFLRELLKISHGKNYQVLKDIFQKVNSNQVSAETDNRLICRIMNGECNQFIPAGKYYFIAFPFSEKGIEDKIIKALKYKFPDLEPKIARGVLENKTALCQICQFILSSKFGIYVLNKYTSDGNRYLPNSNVTLELGLAMGHRKKYIMLVESGTEIISDLQGLLRIPYDNPEDIPKVIGQYDFSNFHREEI